MQRQNQAGKGDWKFKSYKQSTTRRTLLLYVTRWQDTGRYVLAATIQILEEATDLRGKDTAKAYLESLERQETIEAILLYLT